MDTILQWLQSVQWSTNQVVGTVSPTDSCSGTTGLVMTGHGLTDAGGQWTMAVATTECPQLSPVDTGLRPSFVALPVSDGQPQPVVLSAAVSMATITVQAWHLNGATASNVQFCWHLVMPTT